VVLYIPEPGYDLAPVGDELMEWLNIHFIEPSTEEGDLLSALEKPWEDESFWPYLTRCVFLSFVTLNAANGDKSHPAWPNKIVRVLFGNTLAA